MNSKEYGKMVKRQNYRQSSWERSLEAAGDQKNPVSKNPVQYDLVKETHYRTTISLRDNGVA